VRFITAAAAILAIALGAGRAGAWSAEKTHPKATRATAALLKRIVKGGSYTEVYDPAFVEAMERGAHDEDYSSVDGNSRSFRHFYDPDAKGKSSGLRYQNYFRVWYFVDLGKLHLQAVTGSDFGYAGIEVAPPKGGYYADALEWARNGAGTGDLLNWAGALRAYGYSRDSRREAYYRLGHVLHLLQDMSEPDHVFCYPHPGSTYRTPPILAGVQPGSGPVKYGFEGLVEQYIDVLSFPARKALRRSTLDACFDDMAHVSKQAVKGKFTLPLGIDTIVVDYFDEHLGKVRKYDIPLLPAIDDSDPKERNRYLALAQDLITHAIELGAGLVEQFHEIVSPPPFVRGVRIVQAAGGRGPTGSYEKRWRDLWTQGGGKLKRLARRCLDAKTLVDETFSDGRECACTIEFGPENATVDPASVKVRANWQLIEGKMTGPRTWKGRFTPLLPEGASDDLLVLEVQARDRASHFPRKGLPEQGYSLDPDPGRPARLAMDQPPYGWRNYRPGTDRNHRIRLVAPDGEAPSDPRRPVSIRSIYIDRTAPNRPAPRRADPAGRKKLWGYGDREDRWIIDPRFRDARPFFEGLAAVELPGGNGETRAGYVDRDGTLVIRLEACDLLPNLGPAGFGGGLAPVQLPYSKRLQRRPIGFIDAAGRVVLDPGLAAAQPFHEGLAAVMPDPETRLWGYMRRDGSLAIEPRFASAGPFHRGRAEVRLDKRDQAEPYPDAPKNARLPDGHGGIGDIASYAGENRLIDRKGELLEGLWFRVANGCDFHEGRHRVSLEVQGEKKIGFFDERGKLVIPPRFDAAEEFSCGRALVRVGGRYGFIDRSGKWIVKPRFEHAHSFVEGRAWVLEGGKVGFLDQSGRMAIACRFASAEDFSDGLALVNGAPGTLGATWTRAYVDKQGKAAVLPKGNVAGLGLKSFHGGLAAVTSFGLSLAGPPGPPRNGFIDKTGALVVAPRWEAVDRFSEGLCAVAVRKDAQGRFLWGYIDTRGKLAVPPAYLRADPFFEGRAIVLPEGASRFIYIDREGRPVIRDEITSAMPFSGGRAVITDDNGAACIDREGRRVPALFWRRFARP